MKITNYITVAHHLPFDDLIEFDDEVKSMICDGWVPFGGPSLAGDGDWVTVIQAMVKYES